jgi:hypothetical protein
VSVSTIAGELRLCDDVDLLRSKAFTPLSICSGIRHFSADWYLCRALLTRKQWHLMLFRRWSKGGQCSVMQMRSHPQTDRPRGTASDLTACRWPNTRAANDTYDTVCGDAPQKNRKPNHLNTTPRPLRSSSRWVPRSLAHVHSSGVWGMGCVRACVRACVLAKKTYHNPAP